MLMVSVFFFVFKRVFRDQVPNFSLFLLFGIMSYAFFHDCTFSAMNSLSAKSGIMRKIYFPRSIIIYSASATCLLSYLINMTVLLILVGVMKGFTPLVLLVPIPIICLILFSTG